MESPLSQEEVKHIRNHEDHSHCNQDEEDSVLRIWESKTLEKIIKFVNCGCEDIEELKNIMPDNGYRGGHVLRTEESISNTSHFASLYQSARVGDFSYRFAKLSARDYLVDFHFAEIISTNRPKGLRIFNIFIQEEKVVSNLDIYSIVGANKLLHLVDIRVSVGDNGVLSIRFEGVQGSPIISGICVKEAPNLSASKQERFWCEKCQSKMEFSSAESKV